MLLMSVYLILLFHLVVVSSSFFCVFFRCVSHPLSLPLSSCLGCIPPLIGLSLLCSLLRRVLCDCLLFVSYVCAFVCVFCFLLIHFYFFPSSMATMSFAGYFLLARSLLYVFPTFFQTYIPGLIWVGSVYLVTTAGFVADQLM